ncbi:MAG: hypothetical protein II899_12340 [Bacteroidales bacterium]|nr:hypothetical protein [Bacteroidales bacterium]
MESADCQHGKDDALPAPSPPEGETGVWMLFWKDRLVEHKLQLRCFFPVSCYKSNIKFAKISFLFQIAVLWINLAKMLIGDLNDVEINALVLCPKQIIHDLFLYEKISFIFCKETIFFSQSSCPIACKNVPKQRFWQESAMGLDMETSDDIK